MKVGVGVAEDVIVRFVLDKFVILVSIDFVLFIEHHVVLLCNVSQCIAGPINPFNSIRKTNKEKKGKKAKKKEY
jgi:hypothetical protein